MSIVYVNGSATAPEKTPGAWNLITHVCNDVGAWGAGFVLAVNTLEPRAKKAYMDWSRNNTHPWATGVFTLGEYQLVPVTGHDDLFVCNMIGQISPWADHKKNGPPVRYEAIRAALRKLGIRLARSKKPGHIHAPTFGAGLAGGNWNKIEQIIKDEIVNRGIKVTIYKYQRPSRPKRSR